MLANTRNSEIAARVADWLALVSCGFGVVSAGCALLSHVAKRECLARNAWARAESGYWLAAALLLAVGIALHAMVRRRVRVAPSRIGAWWLLSPTVIAASAISGLVAPRPRHHESFSRSGIVESAATDLFLILLIVFVVKSLAARWLLGRSHSSARELGGRTWAIVAATTIPAFAMLVHFVARFLSNNASCANEELWLLAFWVNVVAVEARAIQALARGGFFGAGLVPWPLSERRALAIAVASNLAALLALIALGSLLAAVLG